MSQDGATIQILKHEFVSYLFRINCIKIIDKMCYEYCFVTFSPQSIGINSFCFEDLYKTSSFNQNLCKTLRTIIIYNFNKNITFGVFSLTKLLS